MAASLSWNSLSRPSSNQTNISYTSKRRAGIGCKLGSLLVLLLAWIVISGLRLDLSAWSLSETSRQAKNMAAAQTDDTSILNDKESFALPSLVYWIVPPEVDGNEKAWREWTHGLEDSNTAITRIAAWTEQDVQASLQNKTLKFENDIVLSSNPQAPNEYTYADAAQVLSHLTTISRAYQENPEAQHVWILEGRVFFQPDKNRQNKTLKFENDIVLSSNPQAPNEYTYADAAQVLSHLTTISRAYQENPEAQHVWILEGRVFFQPDKNRLHRQYFNGAPDDWTILSWATTNIPSLQQGCQVSEPWMSWLPGMKGTHAYQINHKGITALLHLFGRDTTTSWIFPETLSHLLLAEEVLFGATAGQRVYTSTFPLVLPSGVEEQQACTTSERDKKDGRIPARKESILAFMNVRFESLSRLEMELAQIKNDVQFLCRIHTFKCDWIIKAVVAKANLDNPKSINNTKPTFDKALLAADFPDNVQFEIVRSFQRFNKFAFLQNHVQKMGRYDLVLFKDADQRLVGFPWSTFVATKGDACMAGPLRQTFEESMVRHQGKPKSQGFQLNDAQGWRSLENPNWNRLLAGIQALEVPFLEMYLDLFDGKFAQWFFGKILTKEFVKQDVSWGPDLSWCPAAREYDPNRTACVLVPLVSVHEDSRQLHKEKSDFIGKAQKASNYFKHTPQFSSWYNHSTQYKKFVHKKSLAVIEEDCISRLQQVQTSGMEESMVSADQPDIAACLWSFV